MTRSLLALLVLAFAAPARGQTEPVELTVGTKSTPPFAIRGAGGIWSGISIDLWNRIADDLPATTTYAETDLEGLFNGVRDGSFDLAVAAITVTRAREDEFDFTHPIYSTGLAIAVGADGNAALGVVRGLLSPAFFRVLLSLLALLLVVGAVTWLLERRRNPEQFPPDPVRGIGAGLWWAAVTMTTVGYGDKAPESLGGRLLGLVWMFAAIIVISGFTAAIASSLTVSRLGTGISGPGDLPKVRVASVSGTASEAYLQRNHIAFLGVASVREGMDAVLADRADAMVYDAPILRYLAHEEYAGRIKVLPGVFERQDYAILLPAGSPLRERINRILLEKTHSEWWREELGRYLGS